MPEIPFSNQTVVRLHIIWKLSEFGFSKLSLSMLFTP
ncbi:hypothetical protein PVAG01_02709 [Phlyctema vagabunda]|uniref:Uncharacterized protein n=1 Tax=Phlyctema vagabunda TaxID=108571 RepID=A0ABR4PRW2_9HELO